MGGRHQILLFALAAPHFTTSSHSPSFVCSIKVQELPPISRTILLKIGTLVRLRQENSTRLHQRHRTSRFIPNNTARSHCLPVHIERPYSNRASPSRASNKCASILTSTLPINPIPVRAYRVRPKTTNLEPQVPQCQRPIKLPTAATNTSAITLSTRFRTKDIWHGRLELVG